MSLNNAEGRLVRKPVKHYVTPRVCAYTSHRLAKPPKHMEPNVISITRAAERAGVSRVTIWRAIKRGRINAVDIGAKGDAILLDDDWARYLKTKTVGETDEHERTTERDDD